uniref:Uncharacterized protein n=1 Tax=Rhizophora mucronata TaxID=61149 RepID=A0A2P2NR39_RHIMU
MKTRTPPSHGPDRHQPIADSCASVLLTRVVPKRRRRGV